MKDDINAILNYLSCEGEMFLLRNRIFSLSAARPDELQQIIYDLLDVIQQINLTNHKHAGYYYFFLGCLYLEQDQFQRAISSLQSAINEMWGAQLNKALAHWLIGLSHSNLQDFPKARDELQEALRILAAQRGAASQRTDREQRSRRSIQQNIKEAYERLFNEPLFRTVRPEPSKSPNQFPVQDPPKDGNDSMPFPFNMPISIVNENNPINHVPVSITNENYPVNKISSVPPSQPRKEDEQGSTTAEYETRPDNGHLSIQSIPIYGGYARAGASGGPELRSQSHQFAEFSEIILDDVLHIIYTLKTNKVNVNKDGNWGWIKVRGKSMNKMRGGIPIDDGDFVLIKETLDANDNDIVIAVDSCDGLTYVKRFRAHEKMLYSETSESGREYAPIPIESDCFKIAGIVYAVAKPKFP